MSRIDLPPFEWLVAQARAHEPLDGYAPEVDELHDGAEIAAWLRIKPRSITDLRHQGKFPEPDAQYGRTPVWKPRTVVSFYAQHRPGRGAPGRSRPRKSKETP